MQRSYAHLSNNTLAIQRCRTGSEDDLCVVDLDSIEYLQILRQIYQAEPSTNIDKSLDTAVSASMVVIILH